MLEVLTTKAIAAAQETAGVPSLVRLGDDGVLVEALPTDRSVVAKNSY
jgi:hypothetical protein